MAPKLKSPSPSTIQVRKALSTTPKTPEDLIKETGLPYNAVSVALRTICSSTEDVIRTKVGRTYFYCLVDNSKVANLEGEEEVCNNHTPQKINVRIRNITLKLALLSDSSRGATGPRKDLIDEMRRDYEMLLRAS